MTRLLVCLVLAFAAFPALAAQITFEGIDGKVLVRRHLGQADLKKSVGELSLETLEKSLAKERFEADVVSVTEVMGLRTTTIRFDDGSMRAYGWCYTVNGRAPNELADEVLLSSRKDRIRWYYGDMAYSPSNGWDTVCHPVTTTSQH